MKTNTWNTYHITEGAPSIKSNKISIFSCMNKEIENIIELPKDVPQLKVNIPWEAEYNISVTYNDISTILTKLQELYDNIFVITDTNVWALYKDELQIMFSPQENKAIQWEQMEAGEINKNISTWQILINSILNKWATRNSLVVAFWWWVVWDISGYVAASANRWIDFLQIPTTLLSIFDASVWGKTWVDCEAGKNKIWAFHNPISVLVNPHFLSTLNEVDILGWWVEWIIKHWVISSEQDFHSFIKEWEQIFQDIWSEKIWDILVKSIGVKAWVVSRDYLEKWERAVLNYWHTFWHALEVLFHPPLNHWVSVWYGIIFSNILSTQLGIASDNFSQTVNQELIKKLRKQKLDSNILKNSDEVISKLVDKITKDKKNIWDDINFILPSNFWSFTKVSVPQETIKKTFTIFYKLLKDENLLIK